MRLRISDRRVLDELLRGASGPGARRRMGAYVVSQAERAFSDQRRGAAEWPERGTPNVAGVLMDLQKGPDVKARRFDPRPAGVDTGRLRRFSMGDNYGQTDKGFEVFTTVPYAAKFQEGGVTEIAITQEMVDNLTLALRKARRATKSAKRKAILSFGEKAASKVADAHMLQGLGWVFAFHKKGLKVRIEQPPRPFLTVEPDDEKALVKIAYQGAAAAAR